jgi:hypothetical protein
MSNVTVASLEGKWPKSVAILTREERHVLDNGRGNPEMPKNPREWVMFELADTPMTEDEQEFAYKIWASRYNSLMTYRTQYRDSFSNYDHYNAAWAACGYNHKQPESAIELCGSVFGEADGNILDPLDDRKEVVSAVMDGLMPSRLAGSPKRAKKRLTKKR